MSENNLHLSRGGYWLVPKRKGKDIYDFLSSAGYSWSAFKTPQDETIQEKEFYKEIRRGRKNVVGHIYSDGAIRLHYRVDKDPLSELARISEFKETLLANDIPFEDDKASLNQMVSLLKREAEQMREGASRKIAVAERLENLV